MPRSEPRLDPDVVDELRRLDAALHAVAADPDAARIHDADDASGAPGGGPDGTLDDLDRELRALVVDVRADRPELDAGTRMRLEERVRAAKAAPPRRTLGSRMPADRRWRAGLALAAVAAVAIPVGVAVREGAGGESVVDMVASGPSGSADTATQETAETATPATPPATAASGASSASGSSSAAGSDDAGSARLDPFARTSTAPAPTRQAPPDAKRRVIRDVTQTVRINPGDVARSAERVTTIVQGAGGYLASSEIRERGARAGGTFQVVVPTGRLDETVAALSRIGRPVRLERSSTDVTDQATSLADQLADLRSDRAAARLQLAKTVDPAKRAARRRELTLLSSRVARLQGQVDQLRRRTATSRIDLRLTTSKAADDEPVPVSDDDPWGIGDAWGDAGRVLEVAGGVLVIGGVIVLPLAALGGLGLVLRRRAATRRREAVIDRA